eukprot:7747292-Pyramimonas_sp.AAC.1
MIHLRHQGFFQTKFPEVTSYPRRLTPHLERIHPGLDPVEYNTLFDPLKCVNYIFSLTNLWVGGASSGAVGAEPLPLGHCLQYRNSAVQVAPAVTPGASRGRASKIRVRASKSQPRKSE